MAHELHEIRLVEAIFLAQVVEQLRIGRAGLAGHDLGRIAGRGAHQHEIERRDDEDHGDELGDAADRLKSNRRGAAEPGHDL
ncbi:hypothetical protein ACVIHF_006754 [Bradyrhizobium sp. USDA 4506]